VPFFYNNKNSVLYIHIPKTGGSSIEEFFSSNYSTILFDINKVKSLPTSPQHFDRNILKSLFRETENIDSFTIVRHPIERLISEYKFRQFGDKKGVLFDISFDVFVDAVFKYYKFNSFCLDNHIRPQSEFILEKTKIHKFEDGFSQQIFPKLAVEYDIAYSGEPYHQKKSNLYKVNCTRYTLQKINEFYKADFILFNYCESELSLNVERNNFFKKIHINIYSVFTLAKLLFLEYKNKS
jgi:hypothetical protein